jgi:hypothetical protein
MHASSINKMIRIYRRMCYVLVVTTAVKFQVGVILQTMGRVKSNVETLMPSEGCSSSNFPCDGDDHKKVVITKRRIPLSKKEKRRIKSACSYYTSGNLAITIKL